MVCRHDLLGMSALSGVSELSLKLLHRHAAMVLEGEIDEESSPDFLWDCAEHWEKAGERERAVELVERCARIRRSSRWRGKEVPLAFYARSGRRPIAFLSIKTGSAAFCPQRLYLRALREISNEDRIA